MVVLAVVLVAVLSVDAGRDDGEATIVGCAVESIQWRQRRDLYNNNSASSNNNNWTTEENERRRKKAEGKSGENSNT